MHPILLVGAALVGLPILLHLIMKQEPKKLLFPAIRFLLQKQKTNQRKMRLRHLLLLLLRAALIALFALTLWQPKLEGSALNLADDQPVAAVLVIDNSPGMGYAVAGVTRFDDAKRRMAEFLDELPAGSRVAVLDANDVYGTWEPTVGDAKRKIDGMKEPAGFASPLTTVLPAAYQLFATADEEGTEPENRLPRVLAVFGDRAANSWDANRVEELKKVRDAGTPAPVHLFFDVGTDAPVNVAIAAAEIRPQLIPATAEAVLTVTVRADGAAVPEAEVTCQLDDAKPERKVAALSAGGQQAVTFAFRDLKPGFHSAVVRLRDDNLAADNVRHVTFQVAERRKLLTVADDPDSVRFWKLSHNFGKQEFDCAVVATKDVATFDGYEAVCLISVGDPSGLWGKVKAYAEAGGKVFVAPPELLADKFNKAAYTDTIEVLPAKLTDEGRDWRSEKRPEMGKDRTGGVTWKLDDDRDLLHPFLAPFRDWKKRGNVDVLRNPARAWRYWNVEKFPGASVIVYFDDTDDADKRSPALLERNLGKGKVVMLTTRLDDEPEKESERWNDYWTFRDTTWATVFPNLIGRYLIGSPDDAAFNFPTGQDVTVPLPRPDGKPRAIVLEGPGVVGRDSKPEIGANQADLRVSRPITLTAGTYTVRTEDRKWEQRFSLAIPAEESVFEKAPEDAITALFGKDSVLPVGKSADLKKLITARTGQPVPLFPWLLMLMLLAFAAEGVFANRFYKAKG